uniref:Gamma-soluble NSF attachment protein n=1 Tax=Haemonchus contortus TaxID=6289 RepID=A0A7I5EDH2_HAECO
MSSSARLSEAAECERKAAECLKTSMLKLKLKPDYDGAATALERASVCYRNAGDAKKAAKALIDAAGNYEQLGNLFHAAKAREGAAMLLRDAGDSAGAFPLFEKAIDQYAESGSLDTAAMSVDKAAKVVVLQEPEKAIKLYEKGLALVQQSDRSKLAGEFLSQITRLNLRLERYSEATKAIRDEIEKYVEVREPGRVGQLTIALVLVQLAMGDSVAAAKYYQWVVEQCAEFEFTDDARACRQLIGGWESGDDEQFQNVLKDGVLRSMDNEYLRLMKKLHAPGATGETEGAIDGGEEDDLK